MKNTVELSVVDTAAVKTPELDAMANDLIDQVRFASGKAVAHIADPRRYPIPEDKNALARILVDAAPGLMPRVMRGQIGVPSPT